jgi:L-lactate dehydrogenase complex protein LldF
MAEMYECDMCCGMGGSYPTKLPGISAPILQNKLKNIKETGAPLIAMDRPGCMLQIRGGMGRLRRQLKHTAELLADQLNG